MNFIKSSQQNLRHVLSEIVLARYKIQNKAVAITNIQHRHLKVKHQGTYTYSRTHKKTRKKKIAPAAFI
jgi:hypothetical protein